MNPIRPIDDERISAYLDNEMNAEQSAAFEEVLRERTDYQAALERIRRSRQAVQQIDRVPAPKDLAERSLIECRHTEAPSPESPIQLADSVDHRDPMNQPWATDRQREHRRPIFWPSALVAAGLMALLTLPSIFSPRPIAMQTTDATVSPDAGGTADTLPNDSTPEVADNRPTITTETAHTAIQQRQETLNRRSQPPARGEAIRARPHPQALMADDGMQAASGEPAAESLASTSVAPHERSLMMSCDVIAKVTVDDRTTQQFLDYLKQNDIRFSANRPANRESAKATEEPDNDTYVASQLILIHADPMQGKNLLADLRAGSIPVELLATKTDLENLGINSANHFDTSASFDESARSSRSAPISAKASNSGPSASELHRLPMRTGNAIRLKAIQPPKDLMDQLRKLPPSSTPGWEVASEVDGPPVRILFYLQVPTDSEPTQQPVSESGE